MSLLNLLKKVKQPYITIHIPVATDKGFEDISVRIYVNVEFTKSAMKQIIKKAEETVDDLGAKAGDTVDINLNLLHEVLKLVEALNHEKT